MKFFFFLCLLYPVLSTLPLASFYYLPVGNGVLFKADFSLGTIKQFVWDFGDGSPTFSTSERSVTYYYPQSAFWKVKLTVIDSSNKQSTAQVTIWSPYNYIPSCDFSITSIKDDDIVLEAKKSQDRDGNIEEYSWNLNDGSENTITKSSGLTYTYQKGGFYNISLTVKDNSNSYSINSCWKKVFINRFPLSLFDVQEPEVDHSAFFNASRSIDFDGNIKNFIWNFGDGNKQITNESLLTHEYNLSGYYNASLQITDNLGNSSSLTTKMILIDIPPRPQYEIITNHDDLLILNGQKRTWTDNNSSIAQLVWDWGDKSELTIQNSPHLENTQHKYTLGAIYNVSLTVIDNFGKKGSYHESILVNAIPRVSFDVLDITNDTVKLKSTSYDIDGNVTEQYWSFGDSSPSQSGSQELQYTYELGGTYNICLTIRDNLKAENSTCQEVFVNRLPTASFSISENFNDKVVLYDNRSVDYDGFITEYLWNWGDSTVPTTENSHNYTWGGFYNVSLTVIDNLNGKDTTMTSIRVNTPPVAKFDIKENVNDTIILDASSSFDKDGIILSYVWDFGDGSQQTITSNYTQEIIHHFRYGGEYNITLTVTDNMNDTSSIISKIFVDIPPLANFDVVGLLENNWVIVTAKPYLRKGKGNTIDLDGEVTQLIWNFGDTVKNISNKTHSTQIYQYKRGGNYTITMYAKDNNGVYSSMIQKSGVFINTAPSAKFSIAKVEDGVLTLNASESIDSDGSIATYCWNFNDKTEITCIDKNFTVQYAYATSGSKKITLTVIDNLGTKSLNTFELNVKVNRSPMAFFYVVESLENGVVTFDISESEDPDGRIVKHLWDFGDGKVETRYSPITENIKHVYQKSGAVTVTLTVFDSEGLSHSMTLSTFVAISPDDDVPSGSSLDPASEYYLMQTDTQIESIEIEVLAQPQIQMFVENKTVNLNAYISNPPFKIMSYQWLLGDGSASTVQTLNHTFAEGGTYNISLKVTDVRGNEMSTFRVLRLNYVPHAAFTFKKLNSLSVQFDATKSFDIDGTIAYYNWTFGDGQQQLKSSLSALNYTFKNRQVYRVQLAIEDNNGDQSFFTTNIDLSTSNLTPKLLTYGVPLFGSLWNRESRRYLAIAFNQSDLSSSSLTLSEQYSNDGENNRVTATNLMFYNHPMKEGYMITHENNGLTLSVTLQQALSITKNEGTVFKIYSYGDDYQIVEATTGKYLVVDKLKLGLVSAPKNNIHLWSIRESSFKNPPLN